MFNTTTELPVHVLTFEVSLDEWSSSLGTLHVQWDHDYHSTMLLGVKLSLIAITTLGGIEISLNWSLNYWWCHTLILRFHTSVRLQCQSFILQSLNTGSYKSATLYLYQKLVTKVTCVLKYLQSINNAIRVNSCYWIIPNPHPRLICMTTHAYAIKIGIVCIIEPKV